MNSCNECSDILKKWKGKTYTAIGIEKCKVCGKDRIVFVEVTMKGVIDE